MDIPIIDRVFGMEGGYVLDFSNRTFAEFFHDELGVDIYDDRWKAQGNSKANRLRCYLRKADRLSALKALNALWEYREASSVTADYPELEDHGARGLLPNRPAPRGHAARTGGVRRSAERTACRCGLNLRSRRPPGRSLHHGPTSPRLCLREVPEGRIRRLRYGSARLLPSQGRADRRQASCSANRPICSKPDGGTLRSMWKPFVPSMARSRKRRAGRAV